MVRTFESEKDFLAFEKQLAKDIQTEKYKIVSWGNNKSSYPWSIWPMGQLRLEDRSGKRWIYDKPSNLDWGRFYPAES